MSGLLSFFTRRTDGRAEPFDATAFESSLEDRLALRKAMRPHLSERALKGAKTKRRNGHAHNG